MGVLKLKFWRNGLRGTHSKHLFPQYFKNKNNNPSIYTTTHDNLLSLRHLRTRRCDGKGGHIGTFPSPHAHVRGHLLSVTHNTKRTNKWFYKTTSLGFWNRVYATGFWQISRNGYKVNKKIKVAKVCPHLLYIVCWLTNKYTDFYCPQFGAKTK